MSRLIDADALIEFCAERWIPLNIDAVNMQPTIQPEKAQLSREGTTKDATSDLISKFIDGLEEIFADLRERHVDDSVCGLCEYDGAYMGQSGDWCNECPGFDRDDCFKLSDETRKKWTDEIIKALPPAQPEQKPCKWIYGENEYGVDGYHCDECGFFVPWDYAHKSINFIEDYNYCPYCGADMRGEQDGNA